MRKIKTFAIIILSAFALVALSLGFFGSPLTAKADNASAVAAAKAAGKYHELNIGFAMPYQNTGWGMKTSDPLVGLYIKGAENVSFKTGDYDIEAKGYVFVSDDVNSEGSDKGNGVYGFTGRGGNGWAFINLNLAKRYKRVTLKKGLIIKAGTNKEEVYELTEDYALYDVNNTYIGGKTIEEALEKAGDTVKYYDTDISSLTKNGSAMVIKYTSSLGNLGVGAPASVSFEKFTGGKGGAISTFGGYFNTSSKQETNHNVLEATFAENEKVTVAAGFKVCFWAENNTKVYVLRTTGDYVCWYDGNSFTATDPAGAENTIEWYTEKAKSTNTYTEADIKFAFTSSAWSTRASKAVFLGFDKETESVTDGKNNFRSEYLWCGNKGLIEVDGVKSEKNVYQLVRTDNGQKYKDYVYAGLNLSNIVAADTKKVTFKKGFSVVTAAEGEDVYYVTALKSDYTVYMVNGYFLPAQSLDDIPTDKTVSAEFEISSVSLEKGYFVLTVKEPLAATWLPGGAIFADTDKLIVNGEVAGDGVWYSQLTAANKIQVCGTKDAKCDILGKDETLDYDTLVFKKGMSVVYRMAGEGGDDVYYKITLAKDYNCYHANGVITTEKPEKDIGTREWFIRKAQENGTYVSTDILFAATKTGWTDKGFKTLGIAFVDDAACGLDTDYKYISNVGYVVGDGVVNTAAITQLTRTDNYSLLKNYREIGIDFSAAFADRPAVLTIKKGFMVAVEGEDGMIVVEVASDYTVYDNGGYYLPVDGVDKLASLEVDEKLSILEKPFTIDGMMLKEGIVNGGVTMLIADWSNAPFVPDKTSYPGGAASWLDGSFVEVNGVSMKDQIWYSQYAGDSGFVLCGKKDRQLAAFDTYVIPDGEEYGTVTFKKGLKIVFFNVDKLIVEIWELQSDYTGWYDADGMVYDTDPNDAEPEEPLIDTDPIIEEKKGCKSDAGACSIAFISLAAIAALKLRKKEN
mgnify:CR=1 FL=1